MDASCKKSILTVVIPVHNRESIVGQTLESVARQTLRPFDLILVDNGSTDATRQVLEGWKARNDAEDFRITVLEEPKPGACAARNRGLAAVTTPWVLFFDSDDIMLPDHLQRVADAIAGNPGADIIGWDTEHIDLRGKRARKPFYDTDAVWHNIMNGGMATQRYAARTGLVRRVGGWNEELQGWNDIELGSRLLMQNPTIKKTGRGRSTGENIGKGKTVGKCWRKCKEGKRTGMDDITVKVIAQEKSITGESFSTKAGVWEKSLDAIEANLHYNKHSDTGETYGRDAEANGRMPEWGANETVNLRRAILAGLYAREGDRANASRLLAQVSDATPGRWKRLLFNLAYRYTAAGGRGAAVLARPFFN